MRPPLETAENLEFRAWIANRCDEDMDFRRQVFAECARDPIFFCNTFIWIYNPKAPKGMRREPGISWPRHQELIQWFIDHMNAQRSGLVPKTREQGATWGFLEAALHQWLFTPETSGLLSSRKKDLVEGKDIGGLFQKLDYMVKNLPSWMVPDGYTTVKGATKWRQDMKMLNPVNGSSIIGDTANPNIGRGQRFTWILGDEFAFCERQDEVMAAAGNASDACFYLSTLNGVNLFSDMWEKGAIDVFVLDWRDNPHHTKGLYQCAKGCRYHPEGGGWHSEWFDRQCANYNHSVRKVAQEILREITKSGNPVFNAESVAAGVRFANDHADEIQCYELDWVIPETAHRDAKILECRDEWFEVAREWGVSARKTEGGRLFVWKPPFVRGNEVYAFGGDTSKGLPNGDFSCGYMMDVTTGEVVAEWHGHEDPDKLAEPWAQLCKWYGTASGAEHDAWATIEWNDQGLTVIKGLKRLGVWVQPFFSEDKSTRERTRYDGIVLSRANRVRLISDYTIPAVRDLDADGAPRLRCPFLGFWQECRTFINHAGPESDFVKPRASKDKHDDRIWGMTHLLYGAKQRFGGWLIGEGDRQSVRPKLAPKQVCRNRVTNMWEAAQGHG